MLLLPVGALLQVGCCRPSDVSARYKAGGEGGRAAAREVMWRGGGGGRWSDAAAVGVLLWGWQALRGAGVPFPHSTPCPMLTLWYQF